MEFNRYMNHNIHNIVIVCMKEGRKSNLMQPQCKIQYIFESETKNKMTTKRSTLLHCYAEKILTNGFKRHTDTQKYISEVT